MGRTRTRRRLIPKSLVCGSILLHLFAGAPAGAQTPTIVQPPTPVQPPTVTQSPATAQSAAEAVPSNESPCEQAGRQAERAHALPAGLLLAIGRVESGRWDAARGRVVPWPWTIDAAGNGTLLDSKQAAVTRTATLRDGGLQNIDVGCYQINLAMHPFAFTDLQQAFDPIANADYAARFLADLHRRLGNWNDAVAAYHSAQPELGIPYRQLVFANWPAGDQSGDHAGDHALAAPASSGPLVVQLASGAQMRIWTPGGAGAGTLAIAPGAPSMSLPRVFSGTPTLR